MSEAEIVTEPIRLRSDEIEFWKAAWLAAMRSSSYLTLKGHRMSPAEIADHAVLELRERTGMQ